MITAITAGRIQEIITEERAFDTLREITDIYLGLVHPNLIDEFNQSKKTKESIFIGEFSGIKVWINHNCLNGYMVKKRGGPDFHLDHGVPAGKIREDLKRGIKKVMGG